MKPRSANLRHGDDATMGKVRLAPRDFRTSLRRWTRQADLSVWLERASRLGYAARGLVYLGMGVLLLLAAVDLAPRARGAKAMLAAWTDWPLGLALIGLVACGLTGFALWRVLQALFDADRHGASAKGLAVRAGQAVSGLVYGGLALSAFELLDAVEDVGEADEEQKARGLASSLLVLPHGDLLLMLAGLVLLGVGLGNVIQGVAQDFAKRLGCGPRLCRRIVPLARIGYGARGLATLPAGYFLFKAGMEAKSADARSWGGALQTIEQQPFGSAVLALLALGLIAFGLFAMAEALFRRIRADAVV